MGASPPLAGVRQQTVAQLVEEVGEVVRPVAKAAGRRVEKRWAGSSAMRKHLLERLREEG
jgi:hypothetical protein